MFYNSHKTCGIIISLFIFSRIIFFMNNHLSFNFEMKDAPDTLTITGHNNGDTVQVEPGTILILKLEAIPGTGYAWHTDTAKSGYLIMIEEPIFLPKKIDSAETAIGSAAYQVFRFSAQKEGTEILKLHYMRIWEKNKPPLKAFSITVNIQK